MSTMTTAMRRSILERLIEHRFGAEQASLTKARRAFAARLYDDAFPKKQRDLMATLPEGWLSTKTYFTASFAGSVERFELDEPRRFPGSKLHNPLKTYEASHPLNVARIDLDRRSQDLSERRSDCKHKALAALNSSRTVAQLLKAWPEIEPFARFAAVVPQTLPAVDTADLNAAFRLPLKQNRAAAVEATA